MYLSLRGLLARNIDPAREIWPTVWKTRFEGVGDGVRSRHLDR